jgi:cation:H+ antiporter
MTATLIWFFGTAVAVIGAGVLLSYAADTIAERTGVGRLTIGVILLAGATTLPEIVVDVSAVRMGAADLGVGDIMGSCVMNMLILAVVDLLYYLRRRASMMPTLVLGHARVAVLSIILAAIAGAAIIAREPFVLGGIGGGVLLIAVIYALEMRTGVLYRAQETPRTAGAPTVSAPITSLRAGVICFAIGAVVIGLSGPMLARTSHVLAETTGLGDTFFGSIFLALITSLPELAASMAALRIGAVDLAIGNLFGSNCFNMAALLLFDAVDGRGPLLAAVEPRHALTALITIIVTGMAMQIVMTRQLRRGWYMEPAASVLVMATLVGVLVMYLAP